MVGAVPTGEVGAIKGAASGEDPRPSLNRGWAVRTDPGARAWHGGEETKWRPARPWYIQGSHTQVFKADIPKGRDVGWAGS